MVKRKPKPPEAAIEDGIPIPGNQVRTTLPYYRLEVGQSFWAEQPALKSTSQAAYYRRKLGWSYKVRTATKDGVLGSRIWRIA